MKTQMLTIGLILLSFVLFGQGDCDKPCDERDALPPDTTTFLLGNSIMAINVKSCSDVASKLSLNIGKKIDGWAVSGAGIVDLGNDKMSITEQYAQASVKCPTCMNVVLDGGANDLNGDCTVTELPECTRTLGIIIPRMKNLLAQMKSAGKRPIVVSYYTFGGVWKTWNTSVATYDASIKEYCLQNGITYVNLRPAFEADSKLICGDGVHPSAKGSAKIAELVQAVM